MKQRLPRAFRNPLSLVCAMIALVNVALIVILTAVMILTTHAGPYAARRVALRVRARGHQ